MISQHGISLNGVEERHGVRESHVDALGQLVHCARGKAQDCEAKAKSNKNAQCKS